MNLQAENEMERFWSACQIQNWSAVIDMLQNDKSLIRFRDENHWTGLHYATHYLDTGAIKYMLAMEDVDIDARDFSGATAFDFLFRLRGDHFAYNFEVIEAVQLFIEKNKKVVNHCDNNNVSLLQCALRNQHILVVKKLTEYGSDVNHINGFNASVLQVAAETLRVDCIKYLMINKACNAIAVNSFGEQACHSYVKILLHKPNPSSEQIEFVNEMLQLTSKSQLDITQTYLLLIDCFVAKILRNYAHANTLFVKILNLLMPDHPAKCFVKKILCTNLTNKYTLIIMELMPYMNLENVILSEGMVNAYRNTMEVISNNLLKFLFELHEIEELMFKEIITEVRYRKWAVDPFEMVSHFCSYLDENGTKTKQQVFRFLKVLVEQNVHFFDAMSPSTETIPTHMRKFIFGFCVPLSNFVYPTLELARLFGARTIENRHLNFNETMNCIEDYEKLIERDSRNENVVSLEVVKVVSLKNLSRMSLRKYAFSKYSHIEALNFLYGGVDVPVNVKDFLCYNFNGLRLHECQNFE